MVMGNRGARGDKVLEAEVVLGVVLSLVGPALGVALILATLAGCATSPSKAMQTADTGWNKRP